jgi:ubiquinone/menaquinone biosynthesis C-methylase UbiE
MMATIPSGSLAGLAFDSMAERYDAEFTFSLIGRSQREVVWKRAAATFEPGDHVLELNCGTGEDAIYLASRGVSVTACDASAGMIERARSKEVHPASEARIEFVLLSTESLAELPKHRIFDGVFSNFSGLNCINDLRSVAAELSGRLRPGAPLLLCMSTRLCLWEVLHYFAKGNLRKALRRLRGVAHATVAGVTFRVYYPKLSSLREAFAPGFSLRSVIGVGITVPPSYLEPWIARHPRLLHICERVDEIVRDWPVVRTLGDHMLLHLEKR